MGLLLMSQGLSYVASTRRGLPDNPWEIIVSVLRRAPLSAGFHDKYFYLFYGRGAELYVTIEELV